MQNFSFEECVEELLRHGARIDVEARMCWPGPHNQNCEERGKYLVPEECLTDGHFSRSSDKLQSAIYYAIDGDEVSLFSFNITKNTLRMGVIFYIVDYVGSNLAITHELKRRTFLIV